MQAAFVMLQKLTNFFHKEPDSKYFILCGPHIFRQIFNPAIVEQKQPQTLHKQMSMAMPQRTLWH